MTTQRGRARVLRVSNGGNREYLTVTVARVTRARIEAMTEATSIPRGRLVDMALATLEVCEDCHGEGVTKGEQVCGACRGERVVPAG